ncbi:hypothetical protein OQA88_5778 [Cercophora sp. LCS_1]
MDTQDAMGSDDSPSPANRPPSTSSSVAKPTTAPIVESEHSSTQRKRCRITDTILDSEDEDDWFESEGDTEAAIAAQLVQDVKWHRRPTAEAEASDAATAEQVPPDVTHDSRPDINVAEEDRSSVVRVLKSTEVPSSVHITDTERETNGEPSRQDIMDNEKQTGEEASGEDVMDVEEGNERDASGEEVPTAEDAMDFERESYQGTPREEREVSILSAGYFNSLRQDLLIDLDNLVDHPLPSPLPGPTSNKNGGQDPQLVSAYGRDQTTCLRHTIRKWVAEDKASREASHFYRVLESPYPQDHFTGQALVLRDQALLQTLLQLVEEGIPLEIFLARLGRESIEGSDTYSVIANEVGDLDGLFLARDVEIDPSSLLSNPGPLPSADEENFFVTALVIVPRDSVVDFLTTSSVDRGTDIPCFIARYTERLAEDERFLPVLKDLCQEVWSSQDLGPGAAPPIEKLFKSMLERSDWFLFELVAEASDGQIPKSFFSWARKEVTEGRLTFEDIADDLRTAALSFPRPYGRCVAVLEFIDPSDDAEAQRWGQEATKEIFAGSYSVDMGEEDGRALVKLATRFFFDEVSELLKPLAEKKRRQISFILAVVNELSNHLGKSPSPVGEQFLEEIAKSVIKDLELSKLYSLESAKRGKVGLDNDRLTNPPQLGAVTPELLVGFVEGLTTKSGGEDLMMGLALKLVIGATAIPPMEIGLWLPFVRLFLDVTLRHDTPALRRRFQNIAEAIFEVFSIRIQKCLPKPTWNPPAPAAHRAVSCACLLCGKVSEFFDGNLTSAKFLVNKGEMTHGEAVWVPLLPGLDCDCGLYNDHFLLTKRMSLSAAADVSHKQKVERVKKMLGMFDLDKLGLLGMRYEESLHILLRPAPAMAARASNPNAPVLYTTQQGAPPPQPVPVPAAPAVYYPPSVRPAVPQSAPSFRVLPAPPHHLPPPQPQPQHWHALPQPHLPQPFAPANQGHVPQAVGLSSGQNLNGLPQHADPPPLRRPETRAPQHGLPPVLPPVHIVHPNGAVPFPQSTPVSPAAHIPPSLGHQVWQAPRAAAPTRAFAVSSGAYHTMTLSGPQTTNIPHGSPQLGAVFAQGVPLNAPGLANPTVAQIVASMQPASLGFETFVSVMEPGLRGTPNIAQVLIDQWCALSPQQRQAYKSAAKHKTHPSILKPVDAVAHPLKSPFSAVHGPFHSDAGFRYFLNLAGAPRRSHDPSLPYAAIYRDCESSWAGFAESTKSYYRNTAATTLRNPEKAADHFGQLERLCATGKASLWGTKDTLNVSYPGHALDSARVKLAAHKNRLGPSQDVWTAPSASVAKPTPRADNRASLPGPSRQVTTSVPAGGAGGATAFPEVQAPYKAGHVRGSGRDCIPGPSRQGTTSTPAGGTGGGTTLPKVQTPNDAGRVRDSAPKKSQSTFRKGPMPSTWRGAGSSPSSKPLAQISPNRGRISSSATPTRGVKRNIGGKAVEVIDLTLEDD